MRRSLFGAPSPRASTPRRGENDNNNNANNSKRRSFAFMKYSPKTQSNTSMRRTREHARQLALQLTSDAAPRQSFDDEQSAASFDLNPIIVAPPTPKTITTTPQQQQQQHKKSSSSQVNRKLDAFVEREQARSTVNKPSSASVMSISTASTRASKTVKSMPTFPSNSSMQATNVQRHDTTTLSTPPSSPFPLTRSKGSAGSAKSFGSAGSGGAGGAGGVGKSNRLVHYAQTPRAKIISAPNPFGTPGGASTTSTTASSAESSHNFFVDNGDTNGGFTFDAFGLDEQLVDQEVSAAMKELAEWEFPPQSFDSPNGTPNGSRASTPGMLDRDGFEDGFRLTGIAGVMAVRQSPAGSDRSSLTSSTDKLGDSGRRNYFKEQAGFATSQQQQPPRGTPPRHPPASAVGVGDGWAEFGSSAFGDAFSPAYAQSEPGFGSKRPDRLPSIPQLLSSSSKTDEDGFFNDNSFDQSGFPATKPKTTSASDVILSDVGVSSEVGVNSQVSDVPAGFEIGKKSSRHEEKKEEDEDSFAAWSTRSPVKGDASWGEDMTTSDDDMPAEPAVPRTKQWSAVKSPRHQQQSPRQQQQPQHQPQHQLQAPRQQPQHQPQHQHQSPRQQHEEPQQQHPQLQQQASASTSFVGLNKVVSKEPTVQELRVQECSQQRTPIDSLKSRLKPTIVSSHKSDIDDLRRRDTSELTEVLERVKKGPSNDDVDSAHIKGVSDLASKFEHFEKKQQPSRLLDPPSNKRQSNASPSYDGPSNRRPSNASPSYDEQVSNDDSYYEEDYPEGEYAEGEYPEEYNDQYYDEEYDGDDYYDEEYSEEPQQDRPLTYKEKREMELRQQEEQEARAVATEAPPQRKLTYREKRELELRKEREEKAIREAEEKAKKPPVIDVAESIRKRIAENKRIAKDAQANGGSDAITNGRNRLKKVSIESKITQFRAPQESQPEFVVKDLKKVEIPESLSAVSPTPSQSTTVTESRSATSGGTDATEPIAEQVKRDAPSPMAALHEAIANKAAASAPPANPMAAVHAAIASRAQLMKSGSNSPTPEPAEEKSIVDTTGDTTNKLNAFFAHRLADGPSISGSFDDTDALAKSKQQKQASSAPAPMLNLVAPPVQALHESAPTPVPSDGRPSLKNDPKYDRYFRMLKVGMPMEVVKHAMSRDGVDSSVMDGDHNKPAGFSSGGVPLKEDPTYNKYFKMLKIGLPMGAIKNAMERDGLDPEVMDRDHNLPANSGGASAEGGSAAEQKVKDTHRRTRLHWETLRKVRADSLWAKIDEDDELGEIEIDEDEFAELFQAELTPAETNKSRSAASTKKGAAVRVIDSKRANNGGIILARLKLTHDEMADAVDRIDHHVLNAEQMQNIIEYLPTSDERKALESYMLSGGVDAAEKFDGLCECEKFMVAMMTVKHARRKVRALLFKMQFQSCMESLVADATLVETACDELSNSVRLRKLLGIVLNVGNRLNTAGVAGKRKAGAFALDSLLKLSQAKAFDKKTTFLHYIVLVVQRNNELLLRFKDDIPTVMKADRVYWDQVEQDLEEVENQLENVRRISLHQAQLMTMYKLRKKKQQQQPQEDDDNSLSDSSMTLEEEVEALRASEIGIFTLGAIKKVSALREKVETTKRKFNKLREYFGEEEKQEMQPHELFNIIATFCRDFEKAKDQVSENMKKKLREERKLKRSNSENAKNGKLAVSRTNSAPLLRASNHQPTMQKVVKDVSNRPPRDGHHERRHSTGPPKPPSRAHPGQDGANREAPRNGKPQRPPPNGANREAPRNGKPQRPPPNGIHRQAPRNGQRPPPPNGRRPAPRPPPEGPDDEMMASPGPNQPTSSAMRQKAMIRRRRSHAQNRSSSNTSTASSVTASMTTQSSSAAPPVSQSADMHKYAALGRRVANNTSEMSPRSNIRQRRREEQRRSIRSGPPPQELQWPEEADHNMDDLDFVLD